MAQSIQLYTELDTSKSNAVLQEFLNKITNGVKNANRSNTLSPIGDDKALESLGKYRSALGGLSTFISSIRRQLSGQGDLLADLASGTSGAIPGIELFTNKLTGATGASKALAVGLGLGIAAFAGFSFAAGSAANEISKSQRLFTTTSKSYTEGVAAFNKIKLEGLEKGGLNDLDIAAKAYARLVSTGLDSRASLELLRGMNNELNKIGGTKDDLLGIGTALAQIGSKPVFEAEELNQIAERLPQIRILMKEAFGTANSKEIQKLGLTNVEILRKIGVELSKQSRAQVGLESNFGRITLSVKLLLAEFGKPTLSIFAGFLDQIANKFAILAQRYSGFETSRQNIINRFSKDKSITDNLPVTTSTTTKSAFGKPVAVRNVGQKELNTVLKDRIIDFQGLLLRDPKEVVKQKEAITKYLNENFGKENLDFVFNEINNRNEFYGQKAEELRKLNKSAEAKKLEDELSRVKENAQFISFAAGFAIAPTIAPNKETAATVKSSGGSKREAVDTEERIRQANTAFASSIKETLDQQIAQLYDQVIKEEKDLFSGTNASEKRAIIDGGGLKKLYKGYSTAIQQAIAKDIAAKQEEAQSFTLDITEKQLAQGIANREIALTNFQTNLQTAELEILTIEAGLQLKLKQIAVDRSVAEMGAKTLDQQLAVASFYSTKASEVQQELNKLQLTLNGLKNSSDIATALKNLRDANEKFKADPDIANKQAVLRAEAEVNQVKVKNKIENQQIALRNATDEAEFKIKAEKDLAEFQIKRQQEVNDKFVSSVLQSFDALTAGSKDFWKRIFDIPKALVIGSIRNRLEEALTNTTANRKKGGFLDKLLGLGGAGAISARTPDFNPNAKNTNKAPAPAPLPATTNGLSKGLDKFIGKKGITGNSTLDNASILAGLGIGLSGIRSGNKATSALGLGGAGAQLGFKLGGPKGAAIGAAIGSLTGLFGSLFKKSKKNIKDLVKNTYQISADESLVGQIFNIARDSYDGDVKAAIGSQQVRDLIKLYRMSTTGSVGTVDFNRTPAGFNLNGATISRLGAFANGNYFSAPDLVQGTNLSGNVVVQNVISGPQVESLFAGKIIENTASVGAASKIAYKTSVDRRKDPRNPLALLA